MQKQFILFGAILLFIGQSTCQRIILPTYRPPPRKPVIVRTIREAGNGEPLWLYKDDNMDRAPATGDHPYLPSTIDDVKIDPNRRYTRSADDEPLWLYKSDNVERALATGDHPYLPAINDDVIMDSNRRYARSLDSPSAKRGGGSHTTSSGSRNTGATHPGYNRRNARDVIRLPFDPQDDIMMPRPHYRIDTFPSLEKSRPVYARVARDAQFPGHKRSTITIPGWNPHAPIKPWQKIRI